MYKYQILDTKKDCLKEKQFLIDMEDILSRPYLYPLWFESRCVVVLNLFVQELFYKDEVNLRLLECEYFQGILLY